VILNWKKPDGAGEVPRAPWGGATQRVAAAKREVCVLEGRGGEMGAGKTRGLGRQGR